MLKFMSVTQRHVDPQASELQLHDKDDGFMKLEGGLKKSQVYDDGIFEAVSAQLPK